MQFGEIFNEIKMQSMNMIPQQESSRQLLLRGLVAHRRAWQQLPYVSAHLSRITRTSRLLTYTPATPHYVPMGETFVFQTNEGEATLLEGAPLTTSQRQILADIPENRIVRHERAELMGRRNKHATFDARTPFVPGKQWNPLPPLAVALVGIAENGYSIQHASMHGSFGRGIATLDADIDVALTLASTGGLNAHARWRHYWPFDLPLSFTEYKPEEKAEVDRWRAHFRRESLPSTSEQFRRVIDATRGLADRVREAVWNVDTVELVGNGRNSVEEMMQTIRILWDEFEKGTRSVDVLAALAIFGVQTHQVVDAVVERIRQAETGSGSEWNEILSLANHFDDPIIAYALLEKKGLRASKEDITALLSVVCRIHFDDFVKREIGQFIATMDADQAMEQLRHLEFTFGGNGLSNGPLTFVVGLIRERDPERAPRASDR